MPCFKKWFPLGADDSNGWLVMPTARHRCPKCKHISTVSGLCPDCKRVKYANVKHVYNTARWAKMRDRVLSEEPICRRCKIMPPSQVDHIIDVADRPSLAYVRSNLQALCEPCHSSKTRADH